MFKFNFVWIRITIIICFFVLKSISVAYSQHIKTLQPNSYNWEIGLNMGGVGLSNEEITPRLKSCKLGYGVSISKQFTPLFGFKAHLLMGGLIGESNYYSFNFKLIETAINGTVNISNLVLGTDRNQLITVYGLVGIGYSNFDGNTVNANTGGINASGYHSGKGLFGYRLAGIVNLGLSVEYLLNNNFNVTFESSFKFMRDNMLDGRVIKSDYDSYNYTSIGIAYKIPFSKNHQWYCQ